MPLQPEEFTRKQKLLLWGFEALIIGFAIMVAYILFC